MKGIFSLLVTLVLGYMLWHYLAPLSPIQFSSGNSYGSGFNLSSIVASITDSFKASPPV